MAMRQWLEQRLPQPSEGLAALVLKPAVLGSVEEVEELAGCALATGLQVGLGGQAVKG